jgi:hypothetical protein
MRNFILLLFITSSTLLIQAQNKLPLVGLDANHEGVIGWNNRAGAFGHLIPEPYNAFGNDTAYYYLRSRSEGFFDQQGKGGMHGTGNFTGFTNLAAKLAFYGKKIGDLSIDFSDMDLNSDTRGTEWDLINDTENRTYIGGTFVIKLNNDTLAIGNTPALKMLIDYNSEQTPFDDVITGKTGFTHIIPFNNPNYALATKEISKALLQDINQLGVRLVFNSIQPAGQTEFDNGTFFAGFFNVADAQFETSLINLPDLPDTLYLCKGDSLKLDAGKGFSNPRWSNNSIGQIITVKELGEYYVQGEYQGDTYISKVVRVLAKPTPNILPMNVTVCEYDSLSIEYIKYLAETKQSLYLTPNAPDSLSSNALLTSTDYYYPIEYGCPTPFWNKITVTVQSPDAPKTYKVLDFCLFNKPIIDSLKGETQTFRWYDSIQGGLPISKSDALIDGKTYFASSLENGCESTKRAGTLVKVNHPDSIQIQWFPVSETSYRMIWKKGPINVRGSYQINRQDPIQLTLNNTDTLMHIAGIHPTDTILVNLTYEDENGCGATFTNQLIIPNLANLNSYTQPYFNVFPNPVSGNGTLTIQSETKNIDQIRLLSLNGAVINTWSNQNVLSLDNIQSGMYVLEIIESNQVNRFKIQIQD